MEDTRAPRYQYHGACVTCMTKGHFPLLWNRFILFQLPNDNVYLVTFFARNADCLFDTVRVFPGRVMKDGNVAV